MTYQKDKNAFDVENAQQKNTEILYRPWLWNKQVIVF